MRGFHRKFRENLFITFGGEAAQADGEAHADGEEGEEDEVDGVTFPEEHRGQKHCRHVQLAAMSVSVCVCVYVCVCIHTRLMTRPRALSAHR